MLEIKLTELLNKRAVIRESRDEAIDPDDPDMKDTTVKELIKEYGLPDRWPRFGHIILQKSLEDLDRWLWWHEVDADDDRPRYELIPWVHTDESKRYITEGDPISVTIKC
jgi:hypothetical protein